MVLAILAGTIGGYVYSTVVVSDSVATASLLVEEPRSTQVFVEPAAGATDRYVANQVAVLESSSMAEAAIKGAGQIVDSLELSLSDLLLTRQISARPGSSLITIEVVHNESDIAIALANSYADAYEVQRSLETAAGFQTALDELDASVAAVNEQIAAVDAAIQTVDVSETSENIASQIQKSAGRLLELLKNPTLGGEGELADVLVQLQTLQFLEAAQEDSPELAVLYEEQGEAFVRRSQLVLRRDQVNIDAALASSGVLSVSPAREALSTISSARAIAVGTLLGVLIGATSAYVLSSRFQRVADSSLATSILSVRLLAEVPNFDAEHLKSLLPVRDSVVSVAAESYRFGAAALTSPLKPSSISSNVSKEREPPAPVVVAFTSPLTGDGKTVSVANVAMAAATRGLRVLMIDCDFGDPGLDPLFDRAPTSHSGLTDVVGSNVSLPTAVQKIPAPNGETVDLLNRGTGRVSAPEFFGREKTRVFFSTVRMVYDLVLLDTPPILQVAYAANVLAHSEGVVLVIRHKSLIRHLQETVDRLDLIGSSVVGYLYNEAPLRPEMRARGGSVENPLGVPAQRNEP